MRSGVQWVSPTNSTAQLTFRASAHHSSWRGAALVWNLFPSNYWGIYAVFFFVLWVANEGFGGPTQSTWGIVPCSTWKIYFQVRDMGLFIWVITVHLGYQLSILFFDQDFKKLDHLQLWTSFLFSDSSMTRGGLISQHVPSLFIIFWLVSSQYNSIYQLRAGYHWNSFIDKVYR